MGNHSINHSILKARQKVYDLQQKKRISKWVKCVDCKYSCETNFESSKIDCRLPLSYQRNNDQLEYDFDKNDFISCVWGKRKMKQQNKEKR